MSHAPVVPKLCSLEDRRTETPARRGEALTTLALLGLFACSDQGPSGRVITETLTTVTVGDPFRVRLQSVGPGEYESPPTLSSPVVQYLGVSLVTPHVPAGVTQEFAFRAVATGRAIVTFHHTGSNPPVADTLDVE
jgi:hypothetical protein